MLAEQPWKRDKGEKDTAHVTLPNFPKFEEFHVLNSWMPYVKPADECFGCKYCVYYWYYENWEKLENFKLKKKTKCDEKQTNIWFPPITLLNKLKKHADSKE